MTVTKEQYNHFTTVYIPMLERKIEKLNDRLDRENNKRNPDSEYKLSIKRQLREVEKELNECYEELKTLKIA